MSLSTKMLKGVLDKLDSNYCGASAADNQLKVALEGPQFLSKCCVCSVKALAFISSKSLCGTDQE